MAGKKEPSIFGKRLKLTRLVRGLTQEDLASKSEVSSAMISHFETGERQTASADNLVKLAEALDISVDYLLGRSKQPEFRDEKVEAVFRRLSDASEDDIDQAVWMVEKLLERAQDEE